MLSERQARPRSCKQRPRSSKRIRRRTELEERELANKQAEELKVQRKQRAKLVQKRRRENNLKTGDKDIKQWIKLRNAVRNQLARARFHQTMINVYEQQSLRSANREKLLPVMELRKAELEIMKTKSRIVEMLTNIVRKDRKQNGICIREVESSGIPVDAILCAACGGEDSTEKDNDILLCDLEGCHRAFHQKCLVPAVPTSQVEAMDPDHAWFCHCCACVLYCISDINEEFTTNFNRVDEIFPKVQDELREAENRLRTLLGESGESSFATGGNKELTRLRPRRKQHGGWKIGDSEESWGSDSEVWSEESDSGSSDSSDEDECANSGVCIIVDGPRKRRKVDYVALHAKLFTGKKEFIAGESDDDKSYCESSDLTANELELSTLGVLYGTSDAKKASLHKN